MSDVAWMDEALSKGWVPPEDAAAAAAEAPGTVPAVGVAPAGYQHDSPAAVFTADGEALEPLLGTPALAAPSTIVVNAPQPGPQDLLTPVVSPGPSTSEAKVTIAEIIIHAIAAVVVVVNPSGALSQTDQTALIGAFVALIGWAATHYRSGRVKVKVAALNNTTAVPSEPPANP